MIYEIYIIEIMGRGDVGERERWDMRKMRCERRYHGEGNIVRVTREEG